MLELISAALNVDSSITCLERMYVAYNAKCNRLGKSPALPLSKHRSCTVDAHQNVLTREYFHIILDLSFSNRACAQIVVFVLYLMMQRVDNPYN